MTIVDRMLGSVDGFPDGRPLHAYRLNKEQHLLLETEIKRGFSQRSIFTVAVPFVLWAAERYRREYDGGVLSWEFLTDPLSLDISQADLRELTMEGLRRLKRPIGRMEGGTQYLRTIAAEGGIPVKLLSGQGGYRTAIVGLVADLSRMGLGCPREIALGFAGRRTLRFPRGYQTEEFRNLFVDFAIQVLELRALAPGPLQADEVESWLDEVEPTWRDGLSLRLDGDAARSLLSEAISVTRKSGLVTDPFCRVLYRGTDDQWSSWIEVEDKAEIAPELIAGIERDRRRLRLAPTGQLASVVPDLLLSLDRDACGEPWDCQRISARRTARFSVEIGTAADLVAMADGKFLCRVRLAGGEPLEVGSGPLFWRVAEMGNERAQALTFAGRASIQTEDPHIWLLTPLNERPDCLGDISSEADGVINGGRLWRLSGEGRVLISGGNASIKTSAEKDEREEIQPIGPLDYRILDGRGTPVFKGMPSILHRRAGRAFHKLKSSETLHRMGSRGHWKTGTPKNQPLGRVDLAVKEGVGGVGARVTVYVVPEDVQVQEVGNSGVGGRVLLFERMPPGWSLRVGDSGTVRVADTGIAEVPLYSGVSKRGRLPFILASPDGSRPLNWALDLPRARGEFQDLGGEVLSRDLVVGMQDLRCWRVVPAENISTDLRVRLVGSSAKINAVTGCSIAVEQPLSALRHLFEELLVSGGPDSELRLRVISGGGQSPRIVLRYGADETRLENDKVLVCDEQKLEFDSNLVITAVDMDDPLRVLNVNADGLSELGVGRWFLLPRNGDAPLRPPRPIIIPAPDDLVGANAPRRADRIAYFSELYRSNSAGTDLLQLAKLVGVLFSHGVSPSSLDQVHALCQAPEIAVRLLLSVHASEVEDMLSLELHGGPKWMFVSPDTWATAFGMEAGTLRSELSKIPALADKTEELVSDGIASKVSDILRLRPALSGHALLGLSKTEPAAIGGLVKRLGELPVGIHAPEQSLLSSAEDMIRRNATTAPHLYEILANNRPTGFSRFSDALRGLIDAPLFIAEVAFGLRGRPTTKQQVELIQAIQTDVGTFEVALPAAVAWIDSLMNKIRKP
ncbi:MAG: STY4851/ECs_5259 family protein [Hoeflea sp.]|uniref:STY4851/ECs_5259 family protein n=1 Tax=Hoeflea sp. TaxID=1940281 RepID=UPI0032998510